MTWSCCRNRPGTNSKQLQTNSRCGRNFVFTAMLCVHALLLMFGNVDSFEYNSHAEAEARTTGYVAEWEFIDEQTSAAASDEAAVAAPPNRIDPAFWQDSSGAWWLFGGQSTADGNLADLWTYGPATTSIRASAHAYAWQPVFQPDPAISSSFPEPSINPILCGTSDKSTIAVYNRPAGVDAGGSNSLLDDNLVWIYKIPLRKSKAMNPRDAGAEAVAGDEGIWTSYVCCDVCDPTPADTAGSVNEKTNKTATNLEFCPHFSKSTLLSKDDEPNSHSRAGSGRSSQSKVEQELGTVAAAERKVNTESGIKVEPILWCAQDSLMALQLTFTKSQNSVSHEGGEAERGSHSPRSPPAGFPNKGAEKVSKEFGESYSRGEIESATFPSTKIHLSDHNTESPPAPPHSTAHRGSTGQVQPVNEFPTTTTSNPATRRTIIESQRAAQQSEIGSTQSTTKISSKDKNTDTQTRTAESKKNLEETIPKYLNWWKFNLATTEWEKLPQVIMGAGTATGNGITEPHLIYKLFDRTACRTSSDSTFVYIFCTPDSSGSGNGASGQPSARDVYLFNPVTSTIAKIPTQIQLNVLFAEDSRMWRQSYSTLHALRVPSLNQTVIMIAYGKLIDFWIHDHSINAIRAAENVWRGPTLDRFQHHDTFYKLRISVLSCSTEHELFLPNPRHMTGEGQHHELILNDTSSSSAAAAVTSRRPSGWFHIKLETDENIFLPSRDTSFMINVDGEDDGREQEQQQEQNSAIENPITATAGANTTTATTTLISPLPRSSSTSFSKVEVEVGAASSPSAVAVAISASASASAEQFPNEKEKIQFNSHSKLYVEEEEEPRAMPLLVNNGSISLQNHDDAVIGKFNGLPSSSSSSKSSSSSFNLSSAHNGPESSSEGTTFIKLNNAVLSSLSQQQQQQQQNRPQNVSPGPESLDGKKAASIFKDLARQSTTSQQRQQAKSQAEAGQTTITRLIVSPELKPDLGQLEHEHESQLLNYSSTVNVAINSESPHPQPEPEPEVEISVRQSESVDQDDSPSPFSPSLELKLANTVVELSGSGRNENLLVDSDSAVIDNNYSKSESVVEDNESAGAGTDGGGGSSGALPIADADNGQHGRSSNNNGDVEARSLWKLESLSVSENQEATAKWSYAPILFYALSLTTLAATGVLFFLRKCVRYSATDKSDEHALCSESRSWRTDSRAGIGSEQDTSVRRLPEEFYLNTPIV